MADSSLDLSTLSEEQQFALQQYTSVTDQNIEAAIPLLRSCQWNAQIAITRFFDGDTEVVDVAAEAARQPPPPTQRRLENIQDTFQSDGFARRPLGLQPAPRVVPLPESQMTPQLPLLVQLFFVPFNLTYGILQRVFRTIAYAFPIIPRLLQRLWPSSSARSARYASRKPLNPRDNAARFIREMEEDYNVAPEALPFLESGYAQAFDVAKRDLKFLIVVLLSPEHDDTAGFVSSTLLSQEFTSFLQEQTQLLLWGGSVRDSEAYQVANALSVTKFPFVGLIVHTPSVSSTAMSIVARIPGATPAPELVDRLRQTIAARDPDMVAARASRREQEAARSIRDEQNSAYERSLATDRERARQRREADAAKEKAEREERERAEAAETKARNLLRWKRWRKSTLAVEPGTDVSDAVRISVRMPSGERLVRKFGAEAGLEELYAFVECHGLEEADEEQEAGKPEGYEHVYGFRLVSPMPREVYDLADGGTIRGRVGRSGNLIVESIGDDEDEAES